MQNTKYANDFEKYLNTLQNPPRTFKKGEIIPGKIVKISKGEALVDIGGRTEGVVLGREMRLEDEVFDKKVGDDVILYVLKPENILGQIELSIRRTGTARKWFELETAQKNDSPVKVTVMEANTGGVIVSIGGGLRGFIPTSQLNNSRIYPIVSFGDKENAQKELQKKLGDLIGEEIEAKVIEIDKEKNRVILSEKLVSASDDAELREETLSNTKVADILDGKVTGIAPFGLFVNAQGLEGLVHLSEISWDKVTNPADFYAIGDKVKVQVIGMQDNGKRIAYSIKRLQKDPWEQIVNEYKVGQKVRGAITKVVDYGAFVRIDDRVNGLIHISEMSDKLVKDPNNHVKIDEEVDVEIISISKEERHLGLSIKRLKQKDKKKTTDEVAEGETPAKEVEVSPEMESLGKILEE